MSVARSQRAGKKFSYLFAQFPQSQRGNRSVSVILVELSKESCSVKYFLEVFVDLVEV